MKLLIDHIAQQLSTHFNKSIQIKSHRQVFGGDINQTYHLQTNIGSFFLKLNDGRLNDMFEKEFTGLALLYQTKTIKIPEPVLYGSFPATIIPANLSAAAKVEISSNGKQIFLITEFIQPGSLPANFWEKFAYQLAAMHKHSHTQFGLSTPNYIGSLPQQNNFCGAWSEFYATQRIMPLIQLAFNQNKCSKEDIALAEKLCSRFTDLFPEEKPALVHGDFWSGNFMSNENGNPVIYDPAVYYGNREMDIAMSLLFGGFDKSFYEYYNAAFPLQPNWRERVQLCQLYPLLVHLILFGGHYYRSVMDIMKRY
jgi:fructosamine-3-kinase